MGLTITKKKPLPGRSVPPTQAQRKEKSDILNEFIQITGYNRKGKKIYTDKVIASWPAFAITPAVREKLMVVPHRRGNSPALSTFSQFAVNTYRGWASTVA
ncbi:MAG: hypothetical protein LBP76_03270 [Treponema sp.]|jgi:hypothetical protein|nr:hypothetical protein [Treponema sp.]